MKMNSRIVSSLFSIATLTMATGAMTYAFFSDTGSSTANVFAAGTMDLQLSSNGGTAANDVTATWTASNMAPGGSVVDGTLRLRNSGSVSGHHAHVAVVNSGAVMAPYLEVTFLEYDGASIIGSITDVNSNTIIDLDDWAQLNAGAGIQVALADLNVYHPLQVKVRLASIAPNSVQGESVTSAFNVTLHQDATQ
jgi:hypothetical protein